MIRRSRRDSARIALVCTPKGTWCYQHSADMPVAATPDVSQTGSCSCNSPSLTASDVAGKQDHLKENLIKRVERIKFWAKATLFVTKCVYLSQQPWPAQIFQKTWSFFSGSFLHIITELSMADSILAHRYQTWLWSILLPLLQGRNNPKYSSSM